jgi:hypothetical protein
MDKGRPALAIAVGHLKPHDEESEPEMEGADGDEPSDEDMDGAKHDAAASMLEAIHGKDPAALVDAVETLVKLCKGYEAEEE